MNEKEKGKTGKKEGIGLERGNVEKKRGGRGEVVQKRKAEK